MQSFYENSSTDIDKPMVWLAKRQGLKYAAMPIHKVEEMSEFRRLVANSRASQDWNSLARRWNEKADGVTIFYKLPEHLEMHATRVAKVDNARDTMLISEQIRAQFDKFITSPARAASFPNVEPRQLYNSHPESGTPAMQSLSHQASRNAGRPVSADIARGSSTQATSLPAATQTDLAGATATPEHTSAPEPDIQFHLAADITSAKTFATRVTKGRVSAGKSLRNKRRCYTCAMMDCPGTGHRPACAGWKGEKCGDSCKKCRSARAKAL
jgi:hypothetical protein